MTLAGCGPAKPVLVFTPASVTTDTIGRPLRADVARECGVPELVRDSLEIATTTGRVSALPAAIAHFSLGGIEVRNATAMIVAAELMQVRIDATNGLFVLEPRHRSLRPRS